MTKTQRPAGASEPPREDIDDLIFNYEAYHTSDDETHSDR